MLTVTLPNDHPLRKYDITEVIFPDELSATIIEKMLQPNSNYVANMIRGLEDERNGRTITLEELKKKLNWEKK